MSWRRFVQLLTGLLVLILLALVAVYWWLLPRRGAGIVAVRGATGDPQWTFLFALYGPGVGEKKWFSRPQGVATDGSRLYVTDTENHRVCVFDSRGHLLWQVGRFGLRRVRFSPNPDWEPGQLAWPTDCAALPDGTVFVADTVNKVIQRLDPGGNASVVIPLIQQDPAPGKEAHATLLQRPLSVAVANNRLYVSDGFRVSRYSFDGRPEGYVGTRRAGVMKGSLLNPWGIVVDEQGSIAVADSLNHRVQAYTSTGKLLWVAQSPVGADKKVIENELLSLPRGMDRDTSGHLFVADVLRSRVVVLSAKGLPVVELGRTGRGTGKLLFPNDVAVTRGGIIFVCDKSNNRVQAFRLNVRLPEE